MTDKQIIINDLKEMIYKLQIECTEKTDNILALGEQLKSAEKTIEILEAKIGGNEYAISDIVKEYQGKLDGKEKECEELKDKLNCCFCNPIMEIADYEHFKKCAEVTECFRRQLDKLEAENDTLFKAIEKVNKINKRLETENEELKRQLESTKGLVTVGNKQLAEALLELQKYEDNEQQEKEIQKLYNKFEGSSLIDYKNK